MAAELNLLSICGSLRTGSYNAAVERSLPGLAPDSVNIRNGPWLGDIPLYNWDIQNEEGFPEPVKALGEKIRAADGVILVTPEYNYSVPGVLKNAIDWVSRLPDQPFKGKPVLLQSASISLLGGARAQYHLRQIMVFVEAAVFNLPEVMVAKAMERIDELTGQLTDEPTCELIAKQLAGFEAFVREHVEGHVAAGA